MSALPQRKKTPAELAELRESLGIPIDAGSEPAPQQPGPATVLPTQSQSPKKRPERPQAVPVEPVKVAKVPVLDAPGKGVLQLPIEAEPPPPAHEPKPIRSLKRSERMSGPVMPTQPSPAMANSKLPGHRHSDEELAEIRRRSALAVIAEGGYLPPQAASTALLVVGYVLAIGGAATPKLLKFAAALTESYSLGLILSSGYHLLVGCALLSLPVAVFIFLKKTLSRHHAAFISIIALFSLVFAILHYFSQFQYGT
jgi:hypothetical protein